jgi:CubicO group peptidase (beta-lactamase class C family)
MHHTRRTITALALLAVTACSNADGKAIDAATVTTPPVTASPPSAETSPSSGDAPGGEWEHAAPAEAGFDSASLDGLAEQAEAAGSSCLMVVRDGVVVSEHAWPGPADQPREAFSITKSLTSLLVGIAQDRGDLALDDTAATYIPEWRGTASAGVTIEDLLANRSGREWSLKTDYRDLAAQATDKTAFAIQLGQAAPPGEIWAYNNAAVQTLSAVLAAATGEHPSEFAESALFGPLGMADSSLGIDEAGNALTFMGLRTTCGDLARLGTLVLNGGEWHGTQVVSEDYVHQATAVSSTELNAAYGYLWWLNHEGTIATPMLATGTGTDQSSQHGQILPAAATDIFWALGFNSQVLAVIPEAGVVAVRMGAKPPADAPFGQTELTQGVLDALVER